MEIRSFGQEAAPKINEDNTIEGFAIVFNRESRIMFDPDRNKYFIEIIRKDAITEELIRSCDVKALLEHNKQRMLARSFNGSGSLSLSIEDYGCKYRFDKPDTSDGNYAAVMIRRRDFFGSSFAYTTDEKKNVEYTKRGDILIRTVNKIDRIFDISIVSDPAYFGTEVTVRSLTDSGLLEEENKEYLSEINNLRNLI